MRAVIVGGGVAGPAVGLALHRAGIESVLLERRAAADPEAGSYLTVSPNGSMPSRRSRPWTSPARSGSRHE